MQKNTRKSFVVWISKIWNFIFRNCILLYNFLNNFLINMQMKILVKFSHSISVFYFVGWVRRKRFFALLLCKAVALTATNKYYYMIFITYIWYTWASTVTRLRLWLHHNDSFTLHQIKFKFTSLHLKNRERKKFH